MRTERLRHQFTQFVPSELEPGTLYVSFEYATVIHACCCGCGNKTVTPLSPAGWSLTFDGESISLNPSIGNGSFPCRSHYWITGNRVRWMASLTDEEITDARRRDRVAQAEFDGVAHTAPPEQQGPGRSPRIRRWLRILRRHQPG